MTLALDDLTPPDHYDPYRDEPSAELRGCVWDEIRRARKHHDCTTCRREVCPSEYYQRTAVPLHTTVVVFVACCACWVVR